MRKGSKMTAEQRARISAAKQGRPSGRTGKRHTAETRLLISIRTRERALRGADHPAWQGGITPESRNGRKVPGYKAWRREVRERAGRVCEACQNDQGKGRMVAHHLEGYATAPDLATSVENGAWLCDDCHRMVHALPA